MAEDTPSAFFSFDAVCRNFTRKQGMLGAAETIPAVRDVSLAVHKGETLGLVGESGCGKSTLARMAVRLLLPSSGDIRLEGKSVVHATPKEIASFPHRLQMIFQDPYSSLNPRLRVGTSIGEALACAGEPASIQKKLVGEMLEMVGLTPDHAKRYPHEFSGGQRQRLAIARALITRPAMVVCDEPVSSLDASVQAQVLGLLKDMQDRLGLTYLFISHDIAVISHMSDRIAVMYRGSIVESATAKDLFNTPLHPYTRLLLMAVPGNTYHADTCVPLPPVQAGEKQSMGTEAEQGCAFLHRCPEALAICSHTRPALINRTHSPAAQSEPTHAAHLVCCHKWDSHAAT